MVSWTRQAWAAVAVGYALCFPAAAQQAQGGAAEYPRAMVTRLAQAGGGAPERRCVAAQPARPGFKGLYPGMRVSELPSTLTSTISIGEREGFIGPDYIQVQFVGDTVKQIAVI
jgi:hypothetical protein